MTTRSRICSVGLTYAPLGKREGPKKTFYFRLGLKEDQSHPHSPQNKITATADTPALHLYPCLLCYPYLLAFVPIRLFCQANGPEAFSLPILSPPHASRGMTLNIAAAANISLPLLLFVSVLSKSPTLYPVATVKQRGTELRQKTSGLHYTRSIPAA